MKRRWTQCDLIRAAMSLGAGDVADCSTAERALIRQVRRLHRPGTDSERDIPCLREQIQAGADVLGSAFIELRPASVRRDVGATYTPLPIVHAMLAWAQENGAPQRVVDPGVGSGRFLLRAARLFPRAQLLGVEIDPLAALITRGNLAAVGAAGRSRVLVGDYRHFDLRSTQRTLFVGNPPYVRHHLIDTRWKNWLVRVAAKQGIRASRLAGLHVHFFMATVLNATVGDDGVFITAAEWMDVNYGNVLRESFLGRLSGHGIVLIEPTAQPFPDATTTAAITRFRIGRHAPSIRIRRVSRLAELKDLSGGRRVSRKRFESESRWTRLAAPQRQRPSGLVELGELCRVHRGQATGANRVWIVADSACGLPSEVLFATVTRARELICAGKVLSDSGHLRRVVDLPENLDDLHRDARKPVERFLRSARIQGAHTSYLARHRRAWWSVGLRTSAPILATYMARRAPVFTRNRAGARHINIAHGLYPRQPLNDAQLDALVDFLSTGVSVMDGRTYAGGLTKFEPREMERLLVPPPERLVPEPAG